MADAPDDALDIEPRPAPAVFARASALVALIRRAALEISAPDEDDLDAFTRETDRFELHAWTQRELATVLTADERRFLSTTAGILSEEALDECLLAALPARALAWSLGAEVDLAPNDTSDTGVEALLEWAPQPWDEIDRRARRLSLRSEETLARERERWELWHWRATLSSDDLDPGEDLATVIAEVAGDAAGAGLVEIADNDFSVNGQPLAALDPDSREATATTTEGYLLALNWICGFGPSWSDVPLYPE